MSLYEFSIIAMVLVGLAMLRFGVPALVMWLLSQAGHHYFRA